eukprot:PLAT7468.2.p1 GENE.PLAT7468.2~~PLAT7468.2.p1  ORF type:complete len:373 (-),score=165.18 PLAT7468.2:180-1298(-)
MFGAHPELFSFFNKTNQRAGRQPHALAGSVLAAVGHLSDLSAVEGAFRIIAHKHCALGVLPEHYSIVHDNFLGATAEVLGDAVTEEVADAWSGVLMHVASHLISMEAALYDHAASLPGGWDGRQQPKEFTVTRTREETATTKSIWLKPADGSDVPCYTSGQFLTVCNNPTDDLLAPRHYTLSAPAAAAAGEGALRLTVRYAPGDGADVPDGIMSSHVHELNEGDHVAVRPPFGCFTRDDVGLTASDCKMAEEVYVTGGVGITTAAAMLPDAAASGRRVGHVHVAEDADHHALKDELAELDGVTTVTHYDGGAADFSVDVAVKQLRDAGFAADSSTMFMLCAAPGMMSATEAALKQLGVPASNIAYENFGPRT